MKLKKKITALCAAILLLVAASLCAAMLWQVREQSYGALLQRSLDSLDELAVSLETAVYQTSYEMGSALSWRVFLTHCFRSCGTAGSALYINGECLFAATPVDAESYLTVSSGSAAASARVRAYGRNFLVLGKAVDFHGDTYCIYLVAEATYIPFAAPGACRPLCSVGTCCHAAGARHGTIPCRADAPPAFSAFGSGRKCCRRELRSARSRFIRRRGGDASAGF